jgi:hypothetical protein
MTCRIGFGVNEPQDESLGFSFFAACFRRFGKAGRNGSTISTSGRRRKRVETLRSMHRNPVQRGLLKSPEQWRRSSFRAYFLGEAGPVAVNKWGVLKLKIRVPAA